MWANVSFIPQWRSYAAIFLVFLPGYFGSRPQPQSQVEPPTPQPLPENPAPPASPEEGVNSIGSIGSLKRSHITPQARNYQPSGLCSGTATALWAPMADDGTWQLLLGPNDDDFAGPFAMPFGFRFYGATYSAFFANNNGTISFGAPYQEYNPNGMPFSDAPAIAPFWADVDTRGSGSGYVWFKQLDAHACAITWDNVGYYEERTDKLNTFQVIIADGASSLLGPGNTVGLSYDTMCWTSGDASLGVGGLGGLDAIVGGNRGNGLDYFEFGRFNQGGATYNGPYGAHSGVHFLDHRIAFVDTADTLPGPVATGILPQSEVTVDVENGQLFSVAFDFISSSLGQAASATLVDINNARQRGLQFSATSGAVARVTASWQPHCGDQGTYTLQFNGITNGDSSRQTTVTVVVDVVCHSGPVFTSKPSDAVFECAGADGNPVAVQQWLNSAIATAPCPPTVTNDFAGLNGDCGGGTAFVTWTATNGCSAPVTYSARVTVADHTPPTLTVPPDIQITVGESTDPVHTGMATAHDTCAGAIVPTYSDFQDQPSCPDLSTITRTWRAVDPCGNERTANQIITVVSASAADCNNNHVPDTCDLIAGTSQDCNSNHVPDECDVADGTSSDCDHNGLPDECDISAGRAFDCNHNGIPDQCDIATRSSPDENNNGIPDECEVLIDLVPVSVAGPEFAYDEQNATVTWTVRNQGNSPAQGNWLDSVYLSIDGTLANATLLSQTLHTGSLAAGASYTQPGQVPIPAGLHGPYFFIVVIDAANQVPELHEDNNALVTSLTTTIIQQQLPDFEVSSLTAPDSEFINAQIQVSWQVTNAGAGTANGSWTDRVYLSTDDQFDPPPAGTDIELGSISNNEILAAGSSYNRSLSVTLPGQGGNYWIFVVPNSDQTISEADFLNNPRSRPIAVEQPDYTGQVSANLSTAVAGTPVTLTGRATSLSTGDPVPDEPLTLRIRVQGTRRVFQVVTDNSGAFSYVFMPLPGEAGNYTIFADHPAVTEDPNNPQASFALAGARFDPTQSTMRVNPGATFDSTVNLENLGDNEINGVSSSIEGMPSGVSLDFPIAGTLTGRSSTPVHFTLHASDSDLPPFTALVHVFATIGAQSAEIAKFQLNVTIAALGPHLSVNPGSLTASMLVGNETIVRFDLTNDGGSPATSVQVLVPCTGNPPCSPVDCQCSNGEWLNVVTPQPIGTIASGQTVPVELSLLPGATLPLGEYPGQVVVTSDQAGVALPFIFRAISNQTGDLRVYAEDEQFYYGAGNPRLAAAQVTVTDAVDGSSVASGITDPNGQVLFQGLPVGWYQTAVTAPGHGSVKQNQQLVYDQEADVHVFVPTQAVTYSWTVNPTTIPDQYTFTITSTFSTDVPVPVITVDPAYLDLGSLTGDVSQVNYTITNHGLIAAQDVKLILGSNPYYQFTPLTDQIGTLDAESSVTIPVTITRNTAPAPLSIDCSQSFSSGVEYCVVCGTCRYYQTPFYFSYPVTDCGRSYPPVGGCPSGGCYGGGSGGGGGGSSNSGNPGGPYVGSPPTFSPPPPSCAAATPPPDEGPPICDKCNGSGNGSSGDPDGHSCGITDPIALYSGELRLYVEDLRIPGRGIDFVWSRTYRSKIGPNTPQGSNWDFGYNVSLSPQDINLVVIDGRGRQDVFALQPDGSWGRNEFFNAIARNADGTFSIVAPDRGQQVFYAFDGTPAAGKLKQQIDRNGNALSFFYDDQGRLIRVNDTLHRDILIGYDQTGHIETVTDFIGRQVRYSYYGPGDFEGGPGDLASVTSPIVVGTSNDNDFPSGKTTTYTYSVGQPVERLNHNLLTITDGRRNDPGDPTFGQGPYVVNVYSPTQDPNNPQFDRVVRQVWGGNSINLVYQPEVPSPATANGSIKTIVRDRNGNVSEYDYDIQNRLVRKREYTGHADPTQPTTLTTNRPVGQLRSSDPPFFETLYLWNNDSLLKQLTHPNGTITRYVYDSDLDPSATRQLRANVRDVHHLPGTHAPIGDQTEIVESYEYDTDHGACCGFNFPTKETDGNGHVTQHSYDANGNRTQTTRAITTVLENWEYNAFGQMTAHVLPDNGSGHRRRDEYAYYSSGPMAGYCRSQTVDSGGFNLVTGYEYDAVGNLIRTIDPRGHDTLYEINALNQVVSESSPLVSLSNGAQVRYQRNKRYDANNNVTQINVQDVDDAGVIQSSGYLTTSLDYEILNYPVRKTEEVDEQHGIVTEFGYDGNRNLALIRFGEATNGRQPTNTLTLVHDERDLVFQRIRALGDPGQSTDQYDYDGNRNRITERTGIESGPHLTSHGFDAYDRLISTTDAMGNVSTRNYDAAGNRVHERVDGELNDQPGAAGNTRLFEASTSFDLMNRLVQQNVAFFDPATQAAIDDGWRTTSATYDDASQLISVTNDNNHVTRANYDTADRLTSVIDAKGNQTVYQYDNSSNVTKSVETEKSDQHGADQMFSTALVYDELDRPISVQDNVGNASRVFYDSRNNRVRTLDPLDHEIRYIFDGRNRLLKTVRDMNGDGADPNTVPGDSGPDIVTTQTWDDSNRLVAQTDDNANTTSYVFDPLNRKVSEIFADATRFDRTLDAHGNVIFWQDANGNRVTQQFDGLDRPTRRDVQVGAGVSDVTTVETFAYDGRSRLVEGDNDLIQVGIAYDSLSHVIREIQNGRTIASRRDALGNRLTLTYPSGRVINTTYDALEHIAQISDPNTGLVAQYSYVGPQRIERIDYGNGTRGDFSYDGVTGVANPVGDFGVRQMIESRYTNPSTAEVIDDRTYAWDSAYRKLAHEDIRPGGPRLRNEYSYDPVNRLIATRVANQSDPQNPITVRQTGYQLDGVGNRISVTGAPDAGAYVMNAARPDPADRQMNQYTSTPFDVRQYDQDGNLKETNSPQRTRIFGYDYRDRLVSFASPDSNTQASYAYDVFGRRVEKTVVVNGQQQITQSAFDSWQSIETTNANNIPASSVFGVRIDEPIRTSNATVSYFLCMDDISDAVAATALSGTAIERYDYQDYGFPLFHAANGASLGGSMIGNRVLFTGREFDSESELYDFRTRLHDPSAGRFVSRDRLGIWADGTNRGNPSNYVGSNPASYLDPYGQYVGYDGSHASAIVYIWDPDFIHKHPGHVSVLLPNGMYVSWWPSRLGLEAVWPGVPAIQHSPVQDLDSELGEGRQPDHAYAIDGRDGAAMAHAWDQMTSAPNSGFDPKWSLPGGQAARNCATMAQSIMNAGDPSYRIPNRIAPWELNNLLGASDIAPFIRPVDPFLPLYPTPLPSSPTTAPKPWNFGSNFDWTLEAP